MHGESGVPLISVIIPCYNHGHYLPDALQSVLAQTLADWEAIVVDDGSSDNTAEVARRYAARDGRIRYLHQENRGLSGARNSGIRAAQGQFLAFLDADDAWEPQFLETCADALRAHPAWAGVYTLTLFVDEAGRPLPRSGGEALQGAALRARLLRGGFFPVHAALVRVEAVRAAGLFDAALTSVEDWDLWLSLTARHEMGGLPQALARYRVYPGSMSTHAERMHRNRMAVLAKHFGPPEGDPANWPEEKRRAYAYAHRAAALGYIAQGQAAEGWALLAEGARLWPGLLAELDTHYELACWDQPRGYRGQASLLDLDRNAALLLTGLRDLFTRGDAALAPYRRAALGQARLALAMLADQAGRWGLARRHLLRALAAHPRLLADGAVLRRLAKLLLGRRLVSHLRRSRPLPEEAA